MVSHGPVPGPYSNFTIMATAGATDYAALYFKAQQKVLNLQQGLGRVLGLLGRAKLEGQKKDAQIFDLQD